MSNQIDLNKVSMVINANFEYELQDRDVFASYRVMFGGKPGVSRQ